MLLAIDLDEVHGLLGIGGHGQVAAGQHHHLEIAAWPSHQAIEGGLQLLHLSVQVEQHDAEARATFDCSQALAGQAHLHGVRLARRKPVQQLP
ncbi:hypothetical protein D3C80_1392490 [compost metagenome]